MLLPLKLKVFYNDHLYDVDKIEFEGGIPVNINGNPKDIWDCLNKTKMADTKLYSFTGQKDYRHNEIYEGHVLLRRRDEKTYTVKYCHAGFDNFLTYHPINSDGVHTNYHGNWFGDEFLITGHVTDSERTHHETIRSNHRKRNV